MKEERNGEETEALIRRVRAGDQPAFAALAAQYAPLIDASLARWGSEVGHQDAEDLRQTALLALYRAALSYDLAQPEVRFGLYAKICMANALVSQLRVIRRREQEVPFGEMPEEAGQRDDPAGRILEEEAEAALRAKIRGALSRYEYRVWCLFAAGKRAGEIAALLGRDARSVENAIYRIRSKLRAALAGPN